MTHKWTIIKNKLKISVFYIQHSQTISSVSRPMETAEALKALKAPEPELQPQPQLPPQPTTASIVEEMPALLDTPPLGVLISTQPEPGPADVSSVSGRLHDCYPRLPPLRAPSQESGTSDSSDKTETSQDSDSSDNSCEDNDQLYQTFLELVCKLGNGGEISEDNEKKIHYLLATKKLLQLSDLQIFFSPMQYSNMQHTPVGLVMVEMGMAGRRELLAQTSQAKINSTPEQEMENCKPRGVLLDGVRQDNPPSQKPNTQLVELHRELNMIEETLVDCSYCRMLHTGPHCYEGTCAHVNKISLPFSEAPATQEICYRCRKRHLTDYERRKTYKINCNICQRNHESPQCQSGTCFNLDPTPFVCPVPHFQNRCGNPKCLMDKHTMVNFLSNFNTLHQCYTCGARHLAQPQEKKDLVNCKFCHTRHNFPHCSVGDCKTAIITSLPLVSPAGFPLIHPDRLGVCRCGKRHKDSCDGSPYPGFEYDGTSNIYCTICTEIHTLPPCSRGNCGEKRKYNKTEPKSVKIKTLYKCSVCGERHQAAPQQFTEIQAMGPSYYCQKCNSPHGLGDCVNARDCSSAVLEIQNGNNKPTLQTRLYCNNCNIRHLDQQILAKKHYPKDNQDDKGQNFSNHTLYKQKSHDFSPSSFRPRQMHVGPIPVTIGPITTAATPATTPKSKKEKKAAAKTKIESAKETGETKQKSKKQKTAKPVFSANEPAGPVNVTNTRTVETASANTANPCNNNDDYITLNPAAYGEMTLTSMLATQADKI